MLCCPPVISDWQTTPLLISGSLALSFHLLTAGKRSRAPSNGHQERMPFCIFRRCGAVSERWSSFYLTSVWMNNHLSLSIMTNVCLTVRRTQYTAQNQAHTHTHTHTKLVKPTDAANNSRSMNLYPEDIRPTVLLRWSHKEIHHQQTIVPWGCYPVPFRPIITQAIMVVDTDPVMNCSEAYSWMHRHANCQSSCVAKSLWIPPKFATQLQLKKKLETGFMQVQQK